MSTLSEGDDIEMRFFELKSQEFGIKTTKEKLKEAIEEAIKRLVGPPFKIIGVDNHHSDAVADFLVAENINNEAFAILMAKTLNDKYCRDYTASWFYVVVPQNHRLSRGMEDLV